jgi:hypothetical protein
LKALFDPPTHPPDLIENASYDTLYDQWTWMTTWFSMIWHEWHDLTWMTWFDRNYTNDINSMIWHELHDLTGTAQITITKMTKMTAEGTSLLQLQVARLANDSSPYTTCTPVPVADDECGLLD